MRELRDLARDGAIAYFIEDPPHALSPKFVSGASLRIDAYWLRWYAWERGWWSWPDRAYLSRSARLYGGMTFDFNKRPPDWERYCEQRGGPKYAHPVELVMILREAPQWQQIGNITEIGEHRIVYEHRPRAVGYAVRGGDFIGGANTGTLGGFLWSQKEQAHYATSCAHVLGAHGGVKAYSPNATSAATRRSIGNIVRSVPPAAGTGKCNRRIQPGAPDVDFGLVEIDPAVSIDVQQPSAGKVTRVAVIDDLGQGDLIEFTGYKSGHVLAKIKECNIYKEIDLDGVPTCFSDLFVIEDRNYNYVTSDLAKPGDSGSWIVHKDGNLVSWDGVLIGGSGQDVYCCYAEHALADASAGIGRLTLPP